MRTPHAPEGERTPLNPAMTASVRTSQRMVALVVLAAALAVGVLVSLALGSRLVAPDVVWHALTHRESTVESEVIRGLRVPRTVGAVAVGGALGLAGAVMQTLTRNPLADPGILGINAGAGLTVVLTVAVAGVSSHQRNLVASLVGALAASAAVHLLSGSGGRADSPARLALAGVAVSAALSSLTQAIILADQVAFNEFRFWVAGSLEGRGADVMTTAAPFLMVGVMLALALGPALGVLSLGDEAATALGVRVRLVRTLGLLCVALLCAGATAVAGPLTFVGLAVPLVARRLVGSHAVWLSLACLLLGAVWLIIADVLARVIVLPQEVPVGVILAALGAPLFIALVRTRRGLT